MGIKLKVLILQREILSRAEMFANIEYFFIFVVVFNH